MKKILESVLTGIAMLTWGGYTLVLGTIAVMVLLGFPPRGVPAIRDAGILVICRFGVALLLSAFFAFLAIGGYRFVIQHPVRFYLSLILTSAPAAVLARLIRVVATESIPLCFVLALAVVSLPALLALKHISLAETRDNGANINAHGSLAPRRDSAP